MNLRKLIPLLLVPALIGLLYTFQRMDNGSIQTSAAPQDLPRYTAAGATLMRFDADGERQLQGYADRMDYFDDASGRAHGLQLDLLSGGDSPWHLSAPAATLPAHQHRFLVEGPVVADGAWPDSGEKMQLHTDRLWVDPDRHELQTDSALDWNGPTRSGNAVGMRADWSGRRVQLLHNVQMRYAAPPR
ncbi:MAG: LPS export ABC transporter periplasmic protein LptC [Nevskia sp.]|nr:LPS export ABC transporter periplasmic protein LptC [Nevskia sp.]